MSLSIYQQTSANVSSSNFQQKSGDESVSHHSCCQFADERQSHTFHHIAGLLTHPLLDASSLACLVVTFVLFVWPLIDIDPPVTAEMAILRLACWPHKGPGSASCVAQCVDQCLRSYQRWWLSFGDELGRCQSPALILSHQLSSGSGLSPQYNGAPPGLWH